MNTEHEPGASRQRPCKQYGKAIYVRATEEEKTIIRDRAKAAGVSASRYLVRFALEGRPPPDREEREELRGIRFLLLKMGTNLNQLAHHANRAALRGEVGPGADEISSVLRGITILSRELKKRLK